MNDSVETDSLKALCQKVRELRSANVPPSEIANIVHDAGSTLSKVNAVLDADLLPHHRRELCEGSGLSEETIAAAGIHSLTNAIKIRLLLNWPKMPAKMGSGIVIPFRNSNGFTRFKPDNPRKNRDGKPIKYESPHGQPNRVFVPPGTDTALSDSSRPLLITEGEKKSLKADQDGFPCIGLTGVFAWKDKNHERLIPDLDLIEWNGRCVFIAFDSDAAEKEGVADAERRLAAQFKNRGADVKTVRFPSGPNGEKVGLDDYLVANGAPALHQLLNEAEEPEAVECGSSKDIAKNADAMREARAMLDATAMHDEGRENLLKLRYWRESFQWWTGSHYREESSDDVKSKVVNFLDINFFGLTTSIVGNVMLCLKAECNVGSHREMPSWFDTESEGNWIPMKNGILNVSALLRGETDFLIPHTPKYFSSNVLPYDFDADATCPKWLAFLDRNLEGDTERIALLQQFSGYCLTPSSSAHKFLFCEGEGANGKSVYCAAMTGMLGTANVSSVPLEHFGERFALYPTIGKLANIASEVGEIDRVAEGILKAYTTGDAIQFDRKHRDPITARPTAKLVFASNNRPRFSDKSGGLWRRMILMPWRITIPEAERVRGMDTPKWWQDQGELPGILLWAIAGLWQLEQQGGFTKSAICEAGLAEYRAESNPTRMYLEENFYADPVSDVQCDDAYLPYAEWIKSNGFKPLSSGSFGHEVRRAFPKVEKRQIMRLGNRFSVYCGIAKR